jgi:hydrogenase maturation protease
MKNTIVLGIGNPLMCDEGIGIRVIEELQSASGNFPEADFLDAGTGGIAMVHRLEGYKKAILIDCALMGQQPGTIKRFTPDDVTSVKQLAHLSLHEADIISVLELARHIGQCPDEVVFFGIEPVVIKQHLGLTEKIESHLPDYIHAVTNELKASNKNNSS